MATWPTTLPAPLAASYVVAPLEPTIRTDMEVGAARVRRRTAARLDQVQVTWSMTDSQAAAFRTWFNDGTTGIAGGSAWFTGLALRLGMGGTESRDCRFSGVPQMQFLAQDRWTLSGVIEVR